jgi:threonine synthase
LRQSGWIRPGEEVVVFNTGAGILYPDTVKVDVPILSKGATIPAA